MNIRRRAIPVSIDGGPAAWSWSGGLFLLVITFLLSGIVDGNDGQFTYMLDDPYIHMAMAKNIAAHGVWGITPYEFSASSSSPVWTIILAAIFRLTGPWDLLPLLLNTALSLLVLKFFADRLNDLLGDRPLLNAALLLFIALVIPLPLITFNGLEHVLQILLALHFILLLRRTLSDSAAGVGPLLFLATLLPLVRYETLFLIFAAALLLMLQGRRKTAALLLAGASCSVLAFGAWQIAHGGQFLPNAVLLKGARPPLEFSLNWFGYLDYLLKSLVKSTHLIVLLIGSLLFRRIADIRDSGPSVAARFLPDLFALVFLLHMAFAAYGSYDAGRMFIRYDAWLVAIGIWAFLETATPILAGGPNDGLPGGGRRRFEWGLILFLLLLPATVRGYHCLAFIESSARNVYDMHYQLAQFIRIAYPGGRVAVHDIGCVNYCGDFRCVDLYGLGHAGFFELNLRHQLTTATLSGLCGREGVDIAVIWKENFEKVTCRLPRDWRLVGEWGIPENVIMYDDKLSFFALNASAETVLRTRLEAFAPLLPDRIRQTGSYVGDGGR